MKVKLKRPFPLLADAIGKPNGMVPVIMPEHLAKTDPNRQVTEMIGSGPYRFIAREFVQGSHVAYQRFEGYVPRQEAPDWTTGGKVAKIERIEWKVISDPSTVAAALQSQEVDWWEQVQPDLLPLVKRVPHLRVQNTNPIGYNGMLRFNHLNPPFNNIAVRRAVALGLVQEDYMRAVTGNEESLFVSCKSLFPCGTRYGEEIGKDVIKGDLTAARAALRASGYNNEKVVILNPADVPSVAPFGHVTFDYLKKLGMNVELVDTDLGTLVHRRTSREQAGSGGWSIFHTWLFGASAAHPAVAIAVRGLGARGWAGWFENAKIESLTAEWLSAATEAERDTLVAAIHRETMDTVPSLPLGRFFINTVYNRDLKGMLECISPLPWNLEWA